MYYGLADIGLEGLGMPGRRDRLRRGEFWALDDISFDVKRGECLGIIGPNGSGKSTLLKLINGIILPDLGSIRLAGRVGSLIELGAGFHPQLTGRENILVNGAILGYSSRELARCMGEIVEFAELREFIDTPVRYYSSGMYVRLGFAIAAHFKPDILLIDEVLAVGDVRFRARCFNTIYRMIEDTAVIIVSHNMPDISRVCDQVVVLDRGKAIYAGDNVADGIEHYMSFTESGKSVLICDPKVELHGLKIMNGNSETRRFRSFDPVRIWFDVTIDASIPRPSFYVSFGDRDSQPVMQCCSLSSPGHIENQGRRMSVSVDLEHLCLNPGTYTVTAGITTEGHGEVILKYHNVADISVVGEFVGYAPAQVRGNWKSSSKGEYAI